MSGHSKRKRSSAPSCDLLSLNTDVFEMIVNQLGVKDTVALASTSALVATQVKLCTSAKDIMAWSKAMTELAFMPASSYWCRAVPFCREHACTFAAAHGNTNMLKHLRHVWNGVCVRNGLLSVPTINDVDVVALPMARARH